MKKAFTLPELLISIVIIGFLLIITMPRVYDNLMVKSRVAAFQRAYLMTSQAVTIMLHDERSRDIEKTYLYKASGDTVESSAGAFLKKYYKIAADCGTSMTPCFASSYTTFDKSKTVEFPDYDDMYCILLATRSSVCLIPPQAGHDGLMFVDANGVSKPNIAGRDLFAFYIYSDGYVGDRSNNANSCDSHVYGEGCFNKLVKAHNWVMDY